MSADSVNVDPGLGWLAVWWRARSRGVRCRRLAAEAQVVFDVVAMPAETRWFVRLVRRVRKLFIYEVIAWAGC